MYLCVTSENTKLMSKKSMKISYIYVKNIK